MALTKASFSMVEGAPFNVVDYGADTTGTTDSTVAVQAAINAANSAGGGEIYFPRGTYKVGSTTSLTLYSKIALRGEGYASVVKLANNSTISASLAMIVATSRDGCSIRDLYFDGNRANQVNLVGLFRVQGCTNFIFSSNWFVNCNNVCIYFTNAAKYCIVNGNEFVDSNGTCIKFGTDTTDCIASNNLLYDTGTYSTHYDGFFMSRFGNNQRLTITNNVIRSPVGSGIEMGVWLLCGQNIAVTNNVFDLPGVVALLVYAENTMRDVTFTENICGSNVVAIEDKTPGFNLSQFNISNNTFNVDGSTAISAAPTFAGVFSNFAVNSNCITGVMRSAANKGVLLNATGSVISNNTITMSGTVGGDGISNSAGNTAISGNLVNVNSIGSRGIVNFADYVSVIGNTVIGSTSYGIRMTSPANYNNVTGNTLRNCALGILNGGANSVTASNVI